MGIQEGKKTKIEKKTPPEEGKTQQHWARDRRTHKQQKRKSKQRQKGGGGRKEKAQT
jgi:hypothetical protein